MAPDFVNRSLIAAIALVALVGVIDGIVDDNWDAVVLLGLVLALAAVLGLRLSWGRPGVPVRADLVHWLTERALEGGESIEQVADRGLSAYRSDLLGTVDHTSDPAPDPDD